MHGIYCRDNVVKSVFMTDVLSTFAAILRSKFWRLNLHRKTTGWCMFLILKDTVNQGSPPGRTFVCRLRSQNILFELVLIKNQNLYTNKLYSLCTKLFKMHREKVDYCPRGPTIPTLTFRRNHDVCFHKRESRVVLGPQLLQAETSCCLGLDAEVRPWKTGAHC